jgi:endonuclease YncB( thermonuclease family)
VTTLKPTYIYAATVVSVHDGDTLTRDVDLGFWAHFRMPCRIAGINAPELKAPGGVEARDTLAALCPPGSPLTVVSVKPDKYGGRFDGVPCLPDGRVVGDVLIEAGVAVAWDGTGPAPVPVRQATR